MGPRYQADIPEMLTEGRWCWACCSCHSCPPSPSLSLSFLLSLLFLSLPSIFPSLLSLPLLSSPFPSPLSYPISSSPFPVLHSPPFLFSPLPVSPCSIPPSSCPDMTWCVHETYVLDLPASAVPFLFCCLGPVQCWCGLWRQGEYHVLPCQPALHLFGAGIFCYLGVGEVTLTSTQHSGITMRWDPVGCCGSNTVSWVQVKGTLALPQGLSHLIHDWNILWFVSCLHTLSGFDTNIDTSCRFPHTSVMPRSHTCEVEVTAP